MRLLAKDNSIIHSMNVNFILKYSYPDIAKYDGVGI